MIDRRHFLLATSVSAASACVIAKSGSASPAPNPHANAAQTDADQGGKMPVQFSLNTSTIRGHKLSITEQVAVASKAGYDGIEPWIRDLEEYVSGGGNLPDLKKRIEDSGLAVVSAIGFAKWIVNDDAERAAGLEQAKRDMDLVKAIGGNRMAAPPIGAHGSKDTSPPLEVIAQRYRALLEVGDATGVVPQLELWGFSPTLSKLPELAYVAAGAQHPSACVLPDFYHIYKGGSDFTALGMIEASRMHCFHINDYPDNPPRKDIADKDRVFPGDGVCALPQIIRGLIDNGFTGTFSLELFNPVYWQRDALEVAKEGLEKSKAVVSQAMAL